MSMRRLKRLAATLVKGGAYKSFDGDANEAKRLGAAFADAVVGGRHKAFKVYRSSAAWSPWFCDVAWDQTWACIDMDRNEVVVRASPTRTDAVVRASCGSVPSDSGIGFMRQDPRVRGSSPHGLGLRS
jgi:hypothetical protein